MSGNSEMTNKLPDEIEKWLEGSQRTVKDVDGFLVDAIYAEDLRELLAKYVLCDKVPMAFTVEKYGDCSCDYAEDDGAGSRVLTMTGYKVRPLYAEAFEE